MLLDIASSDKYDISNRSWLDTRATYILGTGQMLKHIQGINDNIPFRLLHSFGTKIPKRVPNRHGKNG